jgi:hypothetical protein
MYNKLEINKVYWEYTQNNSFMRPDNYCLINQFPSLFVQALGSPYRNHGESIKTDLTSLAKQFADTFPTDKYVLALSGGIDSEITAETFYQLGIPFTAISLRLLGGINDYDIMYAVKFCKDRHIPHRIVELSLDELAEVTVPKAMKLGQFTHSYSQMALTYLFNYVTDEILVFSGHNPDYNRAIGLGWWEDSPNLVKYAINDNKKFFTFTSLEPIFCHYAKNIDTSQPGDKNNDFIYRCYPQLEERVKQTGWEFANKYSYIIIKKIEELQPHKGQSFITWPEYTLKSVQNTFLRIRQ